MHLRRAADRVGAGGDVATLRDREAGPEEQLVGLRRQLGGAHVHRGRLVRAAGAHQLVGLARELVGALEHAQPPQLDDRVGMVLDAQIDPRAPRLPFGGRDEQRG